MFFRKRLILTFLLGILFIGGVLSQSSQRIEIPLKKGLNDSIYFTVKFGKLQCEAIVTPNLNYCSNVITQKEQKVSQCGSEQLGYNEFTDGSDFIAPFQLGDTEAKLIFSVPSPKSAFQSSQLCFGYLVSYNERNTLNELYLKKIIAQPVAFFSLNQNSVSSTNDISVGSLNLGEADQSLLKQGTQFTQLQTYSSFQNFNAAGGRIIKIFDQEISTQNIVTIDVNSPFSVLDFFAFTDLLNLFTEKGIAFRQVFDGYSIQSIFLDSIEQLEPITFVLIKSDNTPLEVSLTPSQYTKLLEDGTYQLLIKIIYYTSSITIGNTILENNVVGFDLYTYSILIAEKQQISNRSNFRGSVSI